MAAASSSLTGLGENNIAGSGSNIEGGTDFSTLADESLDSDFFISWIKFLKERVVSSMTFKGSQFKIIELLLLKFLDPLDLVLSKSILLKLSVLKIISCRGEVRLKSTGAKKLRFIISSQADESSDRDNPMIHFKSPTCRRRAELWKLLLFVWRWSNNASSEEHKALHQKGIYSIAW